MKFTQWKIIETYSERATGFGGDKIWYAVQARKNLTTGLIEFKTSRITGFWHTAICARLSPNDINGHFPEKANQGD